MILELLQYHFLLQILIYQVANLTTLHLHIDIESVYPNKFAEHVSSTFKIPFKKNRIVSLTFSIMKNIAMFPA